MFIKYRFITMINENNFKKDGQKNLTDANEN